MNLNVHFHVLAFDGVFDLDGTEGTRFLALPPPEDAEIMRVLQGFARRLARVLKQCGLSQEIDGEDEDRLALDQPLLAELSAASVRQRVATGPRAGQRVRRLGDRIEAEYLEHAPHPGCASAGGISVHAAVAIPGRDRERLERLIRYAARPAVATERLSRRSDGRLVYHLRRRWRDGTTDVLFEPIELVERLAVLVPPPRFHLVRFYGILAPAASRRDEVVPAPPDSGRREEGTSRIPESGGQADRTRRTGRTPWAELLKRVFAVDALRCSRCGSPTRILAAIQSPAAIRAILECLGLPSRPPPIAPAKGTGVLPTDA